MQLNKWLGSDKPQKDDFNSDNQKIDEACREISQNLEKLGSEHTKFAAAQAVTALSDAVASHTGNSGVHVSEAEKAAWSKSADLIVGSYTGSGVSIQKITLGYQPQFGLIFAVGDGFGRVAWTPEQFFTNAGCISRLGCSQGLSMNSDGFTVEHTITGGLDGFGCRYNGSGVKYVYFIWK